MGAYPLDREQRLVSVTPPADPAVPNSRLPPEDARSLLNRLGPLPFGYAWNIIAQIASALDAAHARGLIHGDVKPANILLEASDTAGEVTPQRAGDFEPGHAYLADFGMSTAFPPDQIVATGQFTGTLDYSAPEQIEGHALDGRADLYSLACTAFELLCGTPPFGQEQGPTLMYAQLYAPPPAATASRAGLPAAVDLVLATAVNKDPADRYPSCGQFAEELGAALGLSSGEPAGLPPSRSPGRLGSATGSGRPAEPPATESGLAAEPPATESGLAAEPSAAGMRPGDPDAMDDQNGPEREPSAPRSRVPRLILAAAAVLVVAGVASGVALSEQSTPASSAVALPTASLRATPSLSPSLSPASTSTPAFEQAKALSMLLTSSAAARTALHDAVTQVRACTHLARAASQLQGVVNQRVGEYSQASALPTSALPDGAALKSELIGALSSSLKADRDYLTWARQQLAGRCTPSDQSSAYKAANGASLVANAAKAAFVQVWNPVAAKYGIKSDSALSI
jgi:serine/threonine protein kinase